MNLENFDYCLPKNLIAQEPMKPRDHSRLLVFYKNNQKVEHKIFYSIIDYFKKGDVLILNNSKVIPARLIGEKKETGGKVEVFLHKKEENNLWNCIVGGRVKRDGLEIKFKQGLEAKIIKNNNNGTWQVKFNVGEKKLMGILDKIGLIPLPPYIKRIKKKIEDKKSYQTIYADNKKTGSVAAPTAGFHFTPQLIKKIEKKGVQIEYITLHVGLGTFAPVKVNDIKKHKMHEEKVEVSKEVLKNIMQAKLEKRRIIAVGTTSVRTLEAIFQKGIKNPKEIKEKIEKSINIFIYPPYKFKVIDALITNFHLPKSTLLMLVSAFAGKKNIEDAYKEAIKKKYRFFSYGDAMFIL